MSERGVKGCFLWPLRGENGYFLWLFRKLEWLMPFFLVCRILLSICFLDEIMFLKSYNLTVLQLYFCCFNFFYFVYIYLYIKCLYNNKRMVVWLIFNCKTVSVRFGYWFCGSFHSSLWGVYVDFMDGVQSQSQSHSLSLNKWDPPTQTAALYIITTN